MSRDRSKGRRFSRSSYHDRDDDDHYRSRRRSLDGRSSFQGNDFVDDRRRSMDTRRSSAYLDADDGYGNPSRTDRAAYRTSSAAHTATRTAGHGVEHIASRGHGAVNVLRGAIGEMWDGLIGDKAGERKNFARVERGLQEVRYGRHAESSFVDVPRNSRGSLSKVTAERESRDGYRRRSVVDYNDGYAAGIAAAQQQAAAGNIPQAAPPQTTV